MIIRNNTNGKEMIISKAAWNKLAFRKKANFTILNDSEEIVQIVENTAKQIIIPVESQQEEKKQPGKHKK